MRVLDLFSGLGGWSNPARDRGHAVVTLDINPRFDADHVRDILTIADLAELGEFDLILASPPCEAFSVASIGRHWTGGSRAYVPVDEPTKRALRIMRHTFWLINDYGARYVIENPRGLMRKVAPWQPRGTTWYCQWGDTRAKPTDIWSDLDLFLPTCRNGASDHAAQSRYYQKRKALGQTGGTQGMKDAAERAVIPRRLAQHVLDVASW